MAGVVGLEPTIWESKSRALTTWLYPNIDLVRQTGLEPVT